MDQNIEVDLTKIKKKRKCHVDKIRVAGGAEVREEPLIAVKPDASLIKPLKKIVHITGVSLLLTVLRAP